MQLSEHFTYEEAIFSSTAVRLQLDNRPNDEYLDAMKIAATGLEVIRHALGDVPLHIDSWYRCPGLNRAVGGAALSAHMMGYAADFTCAAFGEPFKIVNFLAGRTEFQFDQLIQEGTWVHASFDPRQRRQILTAHFGPGGTTYS